MKSLKKYHTRGKIEAGCDEAGRGCLAGPVVAAAVILDPKKPISGLNDSKQLSEKQRDRLRIEIEQYALHWAVAVVEPKEIDRINILNASLLAMHRAIEKLDESPEHLLIDGNRFHPYPEIVHSCIVKGDSIYRSIAAASVLAKTHRDDIMRKLHEEFPSYGWNKNKGYPTIVHRNAVLEYGPTPYHRKSFKITSPQLKIQV